MCKTPKFGVFQCQIFPVFNYIVFYYKIQIVLGPEKFRHFRKINGLIMDRTADVLQDVIYRI